MTNRFISGPTAVVTGSAAQLISRILRGSQVTTILRRPPPWVDRTELAAAVDAIHRTAAALDAATTEHRRDNATPSDATAAHSTHAWTTRQAADYLGISLRRTQELAHDLGGKKTGRTWVLDEATVRHYEQLRDTR
jgi:hypothetical protein